MSWWKLMVHHLRNILPLFSKSCIPLSNQINSQLKLDKIIELCRRGSLTFYLASFAWVGQKSCPAFGDMCNLCYLFVCACDLSVYVSDFAFFLQHYINKILFIRRYDFHIYRVSAIFIGFYEPTNQKLLGIFPENLSFIAHLVR